MFFFTRRNSADTWFSIAQSLRRMKNESGGRRGLTEGQIEAADLIILEPVKDQIDIENVVGCGRPLFNPDKPPARKVV